MKLIKFLTTQTYLIYLLLLIAYLLVITVIYLKLTYYYKINLKYPILLLCAGYFLLPSLFFRQNHSSEIKASTELVILKEMNGAAYSNATNHFHFRQKTRLLVNAIFELYISHILFILTVD